MRWFALVRFGLFVLCGVFGVVVFVCLVCCDWFNMASLLERGFLTTVPVYAFTKTATIVMMRAALDEKRYRSHGALLHQ